MFNVQYQLQLHTQLANFPLRLRQLNSDIVSKSLPRDTAYVHSKGGMMLP